MRARITDGFGLAILRDAFTAIPAPEGTSGDDLREALKARARDGQLFFMDGEDPIDLTVEVVAGGPLSPDTTELFEQQGGAFLLRAPSGRLILSGIADLTPGTLVVPPGAYALIAYRRKLPDPSAYRADLARQIGATDLTFHARVNRLALVGCLPLVSTALALLLGRWRATLWLAAATLVGSLPWMLLSRSRRYLDIDRRLAAYHRQQPLFVLELRPLESTVSLAGGYVTTG